MVELTEFCCENTTGHAVCLETLSSLLYLVFKRGVKHLGFSFMPKFTSGVALKWSCTKSGVAQ